MTAIPEQTGTIGRILGTVASLPGRLPCRLRKKLVFFDRKIGKFPQRRWS